MNINDFLKEYPNCLLCLNELQDNTKYNKYCPNCCMPGTFPRIFYDFDPASDNIISSIRIKCKTSEVALLMADLDFTVFFYCNEPFHMDSLLKITHSYDHLKEWMDKDFLFSKLENVLLFA